MAGKFASRDYTILSLAAAMFVCLALVIVTLPVALIWIKQPVGNAAAIAADAFATVFSLAFLAAFALSTINHRSSDALPNPRSDNHDPICRVTRLPGE